MINHIANFCPELMACFDPQKYSDPNCFPAVGKGPEGNLTFSLVVGPQAPALTILLF